MFSAQRTSFRFLCWLMAFITTAMPSLTAYAQSPQAENLYSLPGACVVFSAKPKQLLESAPLQMIPIEVLQAASIKETGIDPLDAERLMVSVLPMFEPPSFTIMAQFTQPILEKLNPRLTQHTQRVELEGRPYLQSGHPQMPSFFFPNDNVLVAAPDTTLQRLVRKKGQSSSDELQNRLQTAVNDDIYTCIDITPLRPLIQIGLMQADIPQEVRPFLAAPNLIRFVELRLNFSGNGPSELVVEANDEGDAQELIGLIDKALELVRETILVEAARLKNDPDPVQQATGRYQERMVAQYSDGLIPVVDGKRLIFFQIEPGEGEPSVLKLAAVWGALAAFLLPAVQAARESARRVTSVNNIKQILLSLLIYADANKRFPAHASYDNNGKPLLSWRVHILPYLEQENLYKQFHLDEPWDSEHNRQLIARMPQLYLDPSSHLKTQDGKTHYLGVKGQNSIFNGTDRGTELRDIRDGTSNTIFVLQVNDQRTAIWTKPDDWELKNAAPLKGLVNSLHPNIFLAGFADGHVEAISENVDMKVFKALLTSDGKEAVNLP